MGPEWGLGFRVCRPQTSDFPASFLRYPEAEKLIAILTRYMSPERHLGDVPCSVFGSPRVFRIA